jgi:hypothetical protein
MIKKTKAQAGNQAAILVIIIAVLLILFVLSLSPEERAKLLDEAPTNGLDPAFPDSITLIRAMPGHIRYVPDTEKTHELAPFSSQRRTSKETVLYTKKFNIPKNIQHSKK